MVHPSIRIVRHRERAGANPVVLAGHLIALELRPALWSHSDRNVKQENHRENLGGGEAGRMARGPAELESLDGSARLLRQIQYPPAALAEHEMALHQIVVILRGDLRIARGASAVEDGGEGVFAAVG